MPPWQQAWRIRIPIPITWHHHMGRMAQPTENNLQGWRMEQTNNNRIPIPITWHHHHLAQHRTP